MSIKPFKKKNMVNHRNILIVSFCGVFLLCLTFGEKAFAESLAIKEKQLVENNKNFKNAIEENQKLSAKLQDLESQMQKLQSENDEHSTRYDDLKRERDELAQTIQNVRNSNRQYAQEVGDLEKQVGTLQDSQKEMMAKAQDMEEAKESAVTSNENSGSSVGETGAQVQNREQKTIDLLSRIDAFTEQDENLRSDAAKAHYNMGNIYFEKGEYEIAAREYYQAVTLMPNDPDAHYNLALVSSEYLDDQKTALEHYKTYLFLKPDASDKNAINEKIIHAQLILGSKIDSPLDKTK